MFPSKQYNIDDYQSIKIVFIKVFGIGEYGEDWQKVCLNGETVKARKKRIDTGLKHKYSISYLDEFSKPKIIWIELSDESKFALCDDLVPLNTVFFLTGNHLNHILGLLNSKLIHWYFTTCLGTSSGVGTNRWLKYTIEQLPLVCHTDEDLSQLVAARLSDKTNVSICESKIDSLICKMYGLTQEECAYVIDNY